MPMYGRRFHTFTPAEKEEIDRRVALQEVNFHQAMQRRFNVLRLMDTEVREETHFFHKARANMIGVGVLMAAAFLLSILFKSPASFFVGCVLAFIFFICCIMTCIFHEKMHTAERNHWNLLADRPTMWERWYIEYDYVHSLPRKPGHWLETGGYLGGIPFRTMFRSKHPITGKVRLNKDFDQGRMYNTFVNNSNMFPKATHHENGRLKTQEEHDAEVKAAMQGKRGLAVSV